MNEDVGLGACFGIACGCAIVIGAVALGLLLLAVWALLPSGVKP